MPDAKFCSSCGYVGPDTEHTKPPVYVIRCPSKAQVILPTRITTFPAESRWRCCQCGKAVDPGPDWQGGSLYCSHACAYA